MEHHISLANTIHTSNQCGHCDQNKFCVFLVISRIFLVMKNCLKHFYVRAVNFQSLQILYHTVTKTNAHIFLPFGDAVCTLNRLGVLTKYR